MTQEKKDLVPRIARWWLKISEYDFELIFRPGTQLAHADALSRCPQEQSQEPTTIADKMYIVGMQEEDWLSTLQTQDPRLAEIKKVLNGEIVNPEESDAIRGGYELIGERVHKKTDYGSKFVVPRGVRWRVIKLAHDDMGHCGINRTLDFLRKSFWFPNMKPVVTKYINSCIDCLYNKRGNDETRYQIHVPENQPIPFFTVRVDHLGPFPKSKRGNQHLIGLICSFTKFIVLKATRSTNSRSVIKMFDEVSQYFGVPTRIVSDRGTAFTSKEFGKYCQENGIKHIGTAVQTPRANGQIERYFRTIKTAIASMTKEEDGRDWDCHVSAIQWGLNSTKNSTTGRTPQQILLGYDPRSITRNKILLALQDGTHVDEDDIPLSELTARILERTTEERKRKADNFNSTHKPPRQYKKGELVLIKQEIPATGQPKKTQPRYKGPYEIKAVLPNDRYVVVDTATTQVTNRRFESVQSADRMKPWCSLDNIEFDDDDSEGEEN